MIRYRIMQQSHPDREPTCSLMEVIYNEDGSIAAAVVARFFGTTPDEVVHDLGSALAEASTGPIILPTEVKGHSHTIVPF